MRDTSGRNAAKTAALEAHSPSVSIIGMDVTDDTSVTCGFAAILAEGPVDILINNARPPLSPFPVPPMTPPAKCKSLPEGAGSLGGGHSDDYADFTTGDAGHVMAWKS